MNRLLNKLELTAACLGMLITGIAHAEIYQCVHPDGSKEFAQVCPDGTTQTLINKGGTSASSTPASEPSLADQDAAFKKRQTEKADADAKAQKDAAAAEAAQKNCQAARGNLASLQSGVRIATTNPDTGERTLIDDDQRAAQIADAQKAIDSSCKN